jgi:hypothetical protein
VNEKLRAKLQRAMQGGDDDTRSSARLLDDAARIFRLVKALLAMKLTPAVSTDALELACYALQLPMRQRKQLPAGKLVRPNLRERAEQAAELLDAAVASDADQKLLEKTTLTLEQLPQRSPKLDEARILADAVNLDDFGITGLLTLTIQLARQGEGIAQVIDGLEKREQYGYWDARLKDGFHFEATRKLARRRLENARAMAKLLAEESS